MVVFHCFQEYIAKINPNKPKMYRLVNIVKYDLALLFTRDA